MAINVLKKSKVDWIKQKSAPKYFPGQKESAKNAAGILRMDFFSSSGSKQIVMDEESYFGLKMTLPQEMLVSTRNL